LKETKARFRPKRRGGGVPRSAGDGCLLTRVEVGVGVSIVAAASGGAEAGVDGGEEADGAIGGGVHARALLRRRGGGRSVGFPPIF